MFCDMSMVELANAHNCDTSININNYNPHKYTPGKVLKKDPYPIVIKIYHMNFQSNLGTKLASKKPLFCL